MKHSLPWLFLIAILCYSNFHCSSNPKQATTQNDNLEEQILNINKVLLNPDHSIHQENAKKYITLTHQFAQQSPDTIKAVKYAHQGAEVAKNIADYKQAIQIYDDLAKKYRHQPNTVANALFSKAYIIENSQNKLPEARKIYEQILKEYPNTSISQNIPSVLEAMGKSEADLLKMIKAKNK